MFFVKQFIILMKQIFIFGTDKTFTVIFFSVLHDVITYGFGIIIDESSANFLVHKQYAFVIGKLKQIVKHPATSFAVACFLAQNSSTMGAYSMAALSRICISPFANSFIPAKNS